MKILILGSDGRAHAMVWKLFSSPSTEVFCAPGNGGAVQLAPWVDLDIDNAAEVARWAFAEQIDLIVPAESGALWAGMVDEVVAMHIGVFGASQRGTRLEWSRCYAKEFLQRYGLPTARGRAFTSLPTAEKYLAAHSLPVVLKADHPAGGGGVYRDRYAALEGLRGLFVNRPIEGSSHGVVIEEHLPGVTVSLSAVVDGSTALPLLPVRIYDQLDATPESPYAPGMGAITGNSSYAQRLGAYLHSLIAPIVAALAREGLPYWGILGVDCVITEQGPRIAALRCSLRDMEAQVVLPRLEDDLVPIIEATISRRLHQLPPLRWRDEASVGIALVAQGYPNHFAIGGAIRGLSDVDAGVLVFHDQTHNPAGLRYAPTSASSAGVLSSLIMGSQSFVPEITLSGGHVLTVVGMGATLNGARGRALLNAERISFPGRTYREDVGAHEFR